MRAIGKNFLWIFLMAGVTGTVYCEQEGKKTEAILKKVDKEMSLLGQIIEEVDVIVDSTDQSERTQAKKQLKHLMENKDLDEKIKDAIQNDIEIIKKFKTKTKKELHEARQRLFIIDDQINSQANVIDAIAQATKMIENASPEELEQVIAQAKEKIEQAEAEKQGLLARIYTQAKRMVTAPVNYVFGEESSSAKTAFYATVGFAVTAAAGYYLHQSYFSPGTVFGKKDYWSNYLDEQIESSSQSTSYGSAVEDRSSYQIQKYVRERKKALKKESNNPDAQARLHALEEFAYFFFNKNWVPGRYHPALLLRNPENLSNNSPYLEELTSIMQSSLGGSNTSLRVDDNNNVIGSRGMSADEAKADYDEFMKTLHQYHKFITENEAGLSERVNIPTDELYKKYYDPAYINELEKSVQRPKPTWRQRLFGK